ncbi:MAG: hypothetical protein U1E03_14865 [Hyphomonadaceae bacterium]
MTRLAFAAFALLTITALGPFATRLSVLIAFRTITPRLTLTV